MKKIVFLHGAFGTSKDLEHLASFLPPQKVVMINLPFHGKESGPRFNYEILKDSLRERLQDYKNDNIFGYSMGGYLALDLASSGDIHPDSIITFGTRFFWTKEIVETISTNMNDSALLHRVPEYVKELEDTHGPQWKNIVSDTTALMADIALEPFTKHQFAGLKSHIKMFVGDHDKLASPDDTKKFAELSSNAEIHILRDGVHQIDRLSQESLQSIVRTLTSLSPNY